MTNSSPTTTSTSTGSMLDGDTADTKNDTSDLPPPPPNNNGKEFAVGDHVFCWCSYRGLPFAYQQHGIVVEIIQQEDSLVLMNLDYKEETTCDDQGSDASMDEHDGRKAPLWNIQAKQPERPEPNPLQQSVSKFFQQFNNNTSNNNNNKEKSECNDDDDDEGGTTPKEPSTNPSEIGITERPQQGETETAAGWAKLFPHPSPPSTTSSSDRSSQQQDGAGQHNHDAEPKPPPQQQQPQHPFTTGLANLFHRQPNKDVDNHQHLKPQPLQQEENEQQPQQSHQLEQFLHRSESSLSNLFASVPDDRPCTMTRQVISLQEARDTWEHVQYGQPWHKRLVSRAGTCSPLPALPTPMVLMRLHFLQQHPTLLTAIQYHHQKANGECIAAWCHAGHYTSLQGTAKMGQPGLHVASLGMAAEYGAAWGGQVAVGLAFPPSIPFLAAYDIYDVVRYGHAFHQSHHANQAWEQRTNEWNQEFSKYLLEHADMVDRIQEVFLTQQQQQQQQQQEGEIS